MASGTGNLPNQNMTFSPFAILTAEELNDLVENIESLADGSGIGDAAIKASNIDFIYMQAWTPTIVGFSSLPSNAEYYYTKIGRFVTIYISQPNNGTSNSTLFTLTLPVQAANISSNFKWVAPVVQPVDNGSVNTTTSGIATIESNATILTFLRNATGNNWTNSGGKRVPWFQMSYLANS